MQADELSKEDLGLTPGYWQMWEEHGGIISNFSDPTTLL